MLFEVDNLRCTRDERCVAECPARILEMDGSGPVMVAGGEEICIRCGHCVAVCPEEAVTLSFLSPSQCLVLDRDILPGPEGTEMVLRSRRSIRSYRRQGLDRNILEKGLAVAAAAPTGSNRQLVKWLVLAEREQVETVTRHVADWMRYVVANHPEVAGPLNMERIIADYDKGVDRICRSAPQLIFAYADKAVGVGAADCHTALAYLELILPSLGGGSCWAGYVTFAASQWPPLTDYLGLGEPFRIHGGVMAGVPKHSYHRIPVRNRPDITYR